MYVTYIGNICSKIPSCHDKVNIFYFYLHQYLILKTGNSWGCENDLCGLGYGEQEQFYGCADVSVLDSCQNFDHYQYVNGGTVTPKPTTLTPSNNMTSSTSSPVSTTMKPATTAQPSSTTSKPISTTTKPISTTPKPISTTSTPRPTTSSASTTQKPVSY